MEKLAAGQPLPPQVRIIVQSLPKEKKRIIWQTLLDKDKVVRILTEMKARGNPFISAEISTDLLERLNPEDYMTNLVCLTIAV